jgi:excisionase family DNA binding protein
VARVVTTEVGEDGSGLLMVPQVARMLGVSEPTVWRMLRRGELESILVGARSRRVSPEVVEEYKRNRSGRRSAA